MRTEFVEYADPASAIAENDQILPQKPDLDRSAIRLGDFLREARRDPVATHDLPHRRVALDTAQKVIFLGGHHGCASSPGAVAEFCRALFLRYLRLE
jgi:hypothetical protein